MVHVQVRRNLENLWNLAPRQRQRSRPRKASRGVGGGQSTVDPGGGRSTLDPGERVCPERSGVHRGERRRTRGSFKPADSDIYLFRFRAVCQTVISLPLREFEFSDSFL